MASATEQANKVRSEGIKLADKGKEEAYKAAQQLEDAAKKPWEKVGAKLAADKARKKADEAHEKAVNKTTVNKTPKKSSEKLPCPKCGVGKIVRGKTAYGCSLWQTGCTFRFGFDELRQKAGGQKLTKDLVLSILQANA